MSPELKQAVQERIELGYSKEKIHTELREAGYDEASVNAVYEAVASGVSPVPTNTLPTATTLISRTWQQMKQRFDLVLLIAIPSIIFYAVGFFSESDLGMSGRVALGLVALVSFIFILLIQLALVHIAVRTITGEQVPTIGEALAWARSHIWSWLWVSLLTGLVILGGTLLLLIPGIIISFYLIVVHYAYVQEGKRGLQALYRSHELISGRLLSVIWRFIVLAVLFVLLSMPVGIMLGVVELVPNIGIAPMIIVDMLDLVLSAGIAVFTVFFGANLYQALATRPQAAQAPRTLYKVFVALGGLFIALLVLLMVLLLPQLEEFQQEALQQQEQSEAMSTELEAELEAFMQEFEAELQPQETN